MKDIFQKLGTGKASHRTEQVWTHDKHAIDFCRSGDGRCGMAQEVPQKWNVPWKFVPTKDQGDRPDTPVHLHFIIWNGHFLGSRQPDSSPPRPSLMLPRHTSPSAHVVTKMVSFSFNSFRQSGLTHPLNMVYRTNGMAILAVKASDWSKARQFAEVACELKPVDELLKK